ncbi:MAG: rcc01693 family protein [Bosea sp. (in: a-proteobacteria)]
MIDPPERPAFRQFPWADAMALGMGRLRLTPDVFWSLTPKELLLIAGGGIAGCQALGRDALTELMQRFPDEAA